MTSRNWKSGTNPHTQLQQADHIQDQPPASPRSTPVQRKKLAVSKMRAYMFVLFCLFLNTQPTMLHFIVAHVKWVESYSTIEIMDMSASN